MGISDDRSELNRHKNSPTKSVLDKKLQLAIETAQNKRKELDLYQDLDPETDFIWGNYFGEDRHPLTYFDYYFTGQDISVSIDGLQTFNNSDPTGSPFLDLAFNVQQNKVPVYGFWSYIYDEVMRGTRLVTGAFRIATTHPNKMVDVLSATARARTSKRLIGMLREDTADERNIAKYWDSNIEKSPRQDKRLFSVHPQFNLEIEYGVQSTSLSPDASTRFEEVYQKYRTDTAMYTNFNERLVHSGDTKHSMKIILRAVEITGMQVEYTSNGSVCSESYSFFARDIETPD